MYKGFRSSIKTSNNKPIYFVKTKRWSQGTWSVRCNPKNGDVYIISRPENFNDWHKNVQTQLCITHEFGHLHKGYRKHFLDEIMATIYGYFKYRYLCPSKPNLRHLYQFIKLSWHHTTRKDKFVAHLPHNH